MSKIKNLDGLTVDQMNAEINQGAKFVIFQYCVSVIFMTFKRPSDIYFVRANQSTVKHSIGFTIISLVFGWWGIPWGPVYTIGSVYSNVSGGKDVTSEVLQSLNAGK